MKRVWRRAAVVAAIVLFAAYRAQAAECDRACLGGMITKYVDAIVAHIHSRCRWRRTCASRRTHASCRSATAPGRRSPAREPSGRIIWTSAAGLRPRTWSCTRRGRPAAILPGPACRRPEDRRHRDADQPCHGGLPLQARTRSVSRCAR